jgi:ABC-2 type transport system permease protein
VVDGPLAGPRERALAEAPVRVVSARVGLGRRLANLWSRRELLGGLVFSDIRIKYKNSALGIFWSMLSPAFTLAVYFMVFSFFLRNGIPNFVVYLFAGLVVWNMFLTAVSTATGVIVDRSALVKKVSFPREILPLSNVGAAIVYFAVQLGVLVVFLLVLRHAPAWGFLWLLPISFLALCAFSAALSVVMAAVNVYFRDMKHLIEVVLQLWFWLTPVVYSYENSIAPHLAAHGLSLIYFVNPITLIVVTFQRIFYVSTVVHSTVSGQVLNILPTWSFEKFLYLNLALLGVSAVLFFLAEALFGRLEGNFESEL